MNISIIGAGNGGQAMAGHFALLGHSIILYNRSLKNLTNLKESKQITLYDAILGNAKIKEVTDNIEVAINHAELIMIVTHANAHKELAKIMAPYLRANQIVVLNPGRTFGAIEFSKELKNYSALSVLVAEAQSLIYACRTDSPGRVRVIGVKKNVMLAAYPSYNTPLILDKLNAIYNCFIGVPNIMKTSLENIGAIFHPSVILFNAASIERGEQFYFYSDMTPAVSNFLLGLDEERLKIGAAFGIELLSATKWVSYAYGEIKGDSLCEKMQNNPAYYEILAPKTLHSRLLLEDIPTGVLPLIEIAKLAQVETPLLQSVFEIAQVLLEKNFLRTGRTLENLGIKEHTVESLMKIL